MGRHSSADKPSRGDRKRNGLDGARGVRRPAVTSMDDIGVGYEIPGTSSRRRGPLEAAPARMLAQRQRRRAGIKKALLISAGVLGILVIAGAIWGYAYVKHIENTMQGTEASAKTLKKALTKVEPMKPFNLLMLGVDHRPGETQYRTDTMMLVHINPETRQVWMLSIPRDTRAELPGHGVRKINQAHYYDGAEGSINAVEDLTGLKVNHYMEVNFQGFKKTVDALGGVWVNVPEAIDDWKADASPHHRARKIPEGYQRLDGEHALTFVRTRHQFVDQDFTRMANQQLFMRALADQVAKTSVVKIPKVVSAVAPYVLTDMSAMQMIRTAQALSNAGSERVYTATIKGEWKTPFIHPDTELLAKLVGDIQAERSFDSTAPVTSDGTATTTKKPSQITVTVRNGSGVEGVAKQAGNILKAAGFAVGEIGNANQKVYDTTLVVYKTDESAAQLVADKLPPGAKLVPSRGMYTYTTEILVVVGKDWDASKAPSAAGN